MFDTLQTTYRNIISSIAIIGYLEEDIKKRGKRLNEKIPLNCLYSYPELDESAFNPLTYDMMFPDGVKKIECPKFFSLTLTNELAIQSFLYCLKFSEKYKLPLNEENNNATSNKDYNNNNSKILLTNSSKKGIHHISLNSDSKALSSSNKYLEIFVPLVICIKSEKSDIEPFRQLLYSINQIISSENYEYDPKIFNNYKKIELMNLLHFLFSLPHTPPHSLVRFKINNEICDTVNQIDFYFSSNCEIPCNKNDTDIDLLFKILDQSIIIKVLFALLTEKQIIFRASQAYLLHLIIPTFLKLIFPFKWIQTCITILPKENIDYLDSPGSFVFGVLSSTIQIKEIMKMYPGKIIVDCDTNEILGEDDMEPFYPPREKKIEKGGGGGTGTSNKNIIDLSSLRESLKLKRQSSKNLIRNSNSGSIHNNSNNNEEENKGLIQGKNTFIIEGCYIYQYDPENKNKKTKFKFNNDEKNNLLIDTQNSQIFVQKINNYITSDEWKWLRKNIQMVRNPEIFDIENIIQRKSSVVSLFIDETNKSPILYDRPFSYNIQYILMTFYLNKFNYPESNFMTFFKKTNLYLNYLEPKKYQNSSGKAIVENIKETKNQERNFSNCFIVEYSLKPFNANIIIEELDRKIMVSENDNNNNINEKEKSEYNFHYFKKIKHIFMDYCLVLGIDGNQMNDMHPYQIIHRDKELQTHQRLSFNRDINRKSFLNESKMSRGHLMKTKSLLESGLGGLIDCDIYGLDKISHYGFLFYGENGFLNFVNKFEGFMKKEEIDIQRLVYKDQLNNQLINIFKDLKNILQKNEKEDGEKNPEVNIDILDNVEINENDLNTSNNNNIKKNQNNNDTCNENNNNTVNNASFRNGSQSNIEADNSSLINQNILDEIKSVNSVQQQGPGERKISIVTEKVEEENEESCLSGRITNLNIPEGGGDNNEGDFGGVLMNMGLNFECEEECGGGGENEPEDNNNLNNNTKEAEAGLQNTLYKDSTKINNNNINSNNNINNKTMNIMEFPGFEKNQESQKYSSTFYMFNFFENNQQEKAKKIDLLPHYYLFLAYYLEEINSDKAISTELIEHLSKSLNIKINIEKVILKLYKLAFDLTGKKHRDFPYFSYYKFLTNLENENFIKLTPMIETNQFELYDIYNSVYEEKNKANPLLFNYDNPVSRANTLYNINISNEISFPLRDPFSNANLTRSVTLNTQEIKNNSSSNSNSNTNNKNKTSKISTTTSSSSDNNNNNNNNIILEEFCPISEYIINSSSQFDPLCKPGSVHIINEFSTLLVNCFPSQEEIKIKTPQEIIDDIFQKINSTTFKELIGELRLVNLSSLKNSKIKFSFWLNCFNFLILFTIFYKKWNISGDKNWKNFFKNVKYIIGGYTFSFNDIQYILFKKILFFTTDYKPNDTIKNLVIDPKGKKNFGGGIKTLPPFVIFIPTKEFYNPIIFDEASVDEQVIKRSQNYIQKEISIDKNNEIYVNELFLIYEPSFFTKSYNKYEGVISKTIYDTVKKKKYKNINIKNMKWEINFDYLLDDVKA